MIITSLVKYNLNFPTAVFIAQVLVGPSKQLKQVIQIEHNIVKNPNWGDANQLTIYERDREYELVATGKPISRLWSERDSNPGPPNCESDTLTTRLRCLVDQFCFSCRQIHHFCLYSPEADLGKRLREPRPPHLFSCIFKIVLKR